MEDISSRIEHENERYALKSIYGEEVEIVLEPSTELDSEGDWTPLECIIVLHPSRSCGPPQPNSPVVSLHIICPREYPHVAPEIRLEKWKKISDKNIAHLKSELESLASSLKGEVMIFELAQHVEKFLNECNQPDYESFYDEMMTRHKNEQELLRQMKEAEDEKKKKEMRAQIQIQEQVVKKALRRRQNSVRSVEEDFDTSVHSPASYDRVSSHSPDLPKLEFSSKKKEEVNPWTFCEKGQSRFDHEFEHLSSLGKGAFGHVIKVRNKLDDGLYAIKRIRLDPSEKQLNKKITREVKLLSRLNHENVVRYYTSWIESSEEVLTAENSETISGDQTAESTKKKIADEVVEMLPLNEATLEWSPHASISDESDDFIVMFRVGSKEDSEDEKPDDSLIGVTSLRPLPKQALFIYIQMELCEKSTLRLAIDNGLYQDDNRVWRLFREIVEGLCHIHQQGIIHRDLKPVNIFIGHDDHVKIGDFGLATTIVLQKQTVRDNVSNPSSSDLSNLQTSSQQTDASQTGIIGTALYVAPELSNISPKSSYNQKVDIYSLGVIFFEMCSPRCSTAMERITVLNNLRQPEPLFPKDFHLEESSPQMKLMRSMLQYDVEKRPCAQELLQSSAIPPPKREEREVLLMIKRTLANPQSRNYKYLISSCFEQAIQPSLDATYNVSSWRSILFSSAFEIVTCKMRNIFLSHGACTISPPLLTPSGQVSESTVCLMTRSGCIVYATHDLQIPFARFLAQNPGVNQIKRYAVEKVFRERPAGVHPKEIYECAFDIITPTLGDLLPEFELLCVIWEILKEFPSILNKNCVVYLNHSNIISIMMQAAGIDEVKYNNQRVNIFKKNGFYHSKTDFEAHLKSLGLSERSITILIQWMDIEGPLNKVTSMIMPLIKNNEYIHSLKVAFLQLENFYTFAHTIGITCPVLINLGHVRNAHHYSGIMIQIACMQKNKPKQSERSVILSGGRYDLLIQHFKELQSRDDIKGNQHAVGFTLSIDKLIFSIEDDEKTKMTDVLVCAIGTVSLSHDKLSLLQDLWKSGLKSSFVVITEALEEIQSRCKDMGISAIVLLKETDSGFARVRTQVKDRYFEKKINYNEILDYLWKYKSSLMETTISIKPELKSQPSSEGPVITFLTLDKLTPAIKRRYESQILNNVQASLSKLSSKVRVEILALSIDGEITKTLSQQVDPNCNKLDVNPALKKYPKHKKIIQKFHDHVDDISNATPMTVFIIYSLVDNVYNVIV